MRPEQSELERLRREVTTLKAEHDILKKPQPTLPRSLCEAPHRYKASRDLAGAIALRDA
jgi:transposase-like protein